MSDEIVKEITATFPGDWWYLAPALQDLIIPLVGYVRDLGALRPTSAHMREGYNITVHGGPVGGILGIITVGPAGDDETQVRVEPATQASVEFWKHTLERLHLYAANAHQLRRDTQPTAFEVVERYYRSRAAGSRKTLRQIAMETTYSYDYLRKVKRQYDAENRWGSRKNLEDSGNVS